MLAAAGWTMDATGFAAFAAFWSVVFSFGLGSTAVELLLLRLAALRRTSADHVEIHHSSSGISGSGSLRAWSRGASSSGPSNGSAGVMQPSGSRRIRLLPVLPRTLAVQRGVAAGRGDYPRYARQVGSDGVTRLVLAGTLLVLGATSAGAWAMAVCAAGLAGALAARRVTIGPVGDEDLTAPDPRARAVPWQMRSP